MGERFIGKITFFLKGEDVEKEIQVVSNSFPETLELLLVKTGVVEGKYGKDAVVYQNCFVEPFVFESENKYLAEMRKSMTQQQFKDALLVSPRMTVEKPK